MTSSSPDRKGQLDFELNIIPVIDCLTILVTFMLAAGVYYSIAMLDIRLAAGGKEASPATPPKVAIAVELGADHAVSVRVSGQDDRVIAITPQQGKVDGESLGRELASLRTRYDDVRTATLNSNKEAPYQDMVTVLEIVRKSHPDVLLGGF